MKNNTVVAVDDLSMQLAETGLVFVLGKSGSGKSTFLNLIGGLDSPTSGSIIVDDENITELSIKELDVYRNSKVGFVFQDYHLITSLSVAQNIHMPLELQGAKNKVNITTSALKKVDMEGYEKRSISSLSGGQKQRVAIARAFAKDCEFILADEPTGNLDSENGEAIVKLLKSLSKEKLVVVVTHDFDMANKYGDRIIEFSDGKIIDDKMLQNDITGDSDSVFEKEVSTINSNDYHDNKLKSSMHALSPSSVMIFSVRNMVRRPIRFVATVLLLIVTLVTFGLSLSILTNDINNLQTTEYSKHNEIVSFMPSSSGENNQFGTDEIQQIESVYASDVSRIYQGEKNNYTVMDGNRLNNFNFEVEIGELPSKSNEIAIPDFLADEYLLKYNLDNYQELINKRVMTFPELYGNFVLTGIINTGIHQLKTELANGAKQCLGDEFEQSEFENQFVQNAYYSIYNCVYVTDGFFIDYYPYQKATNMVNCYYGVKAENGLIETKNYSAIPQSLSLVSRTSKLAWVGDDMTLRDDEVLLSRKLAVDFLSQYDITIESTDDEIMESLSLFGNIIIGVKYYKIKGFYSGDIYGYYDHIQKGMGIVFNDSIVNQDINKLSAILSVALKLYDNDTDVSKVLMLANENKYMVMSQLSQDIFSANERIELYSEIAIYVCIGTALASLLVMINYIGGVIVSDKYQISMMRALGVSTAQIGLMYLVQSLICMVVALVSALALIYPASLIFLRGREGMYAKVISPILISALTFVIPIVLAISSAIISSVIPILIKSRKTPNQLHSQS